MSNKQSGFSLLELLVAFSIMAFSLGALYQASGGSVRNVTETRDHGRAVLLAESLLAAHDHVEPGGWNESGQFPPFQWQVESTLRGAVEGAGPRPFHRIHVVVEWQDRQRRRSVDLVTLLPQADAPGP